MRPLLLVLATLLATPAAGQAVLVESFDAGWAAAWRFQPLDRRPADFRVVTLEGDRVLRATATDAAAGIWRAAPGGVGTVSWRWRIADVIRDNGRERERGGDDYPARVMVAFGAYPFDGDARVLCYVWAAGEPVGSVFANPYRPNVMTVVVRSGEEGVGEWQSETRNLAADYRLAFGEPPGPVTAVALVQDTDDTGTAATAWWDDLRLRP